MMKMMEMPCGGVLEMCCMINLLNGTKSLYADMKDVYFHGGMKVIVSV